MSEDQKQERSDGLVYKPNSEIPFTGVVEDHWDNGQKALEERYEDGVLDGMRTVWYWSGQKKYEEYYKDGQEDGKWTEWHENGEMRVVGSYKDGRKDGKWTWFRGGEKSLVRIYKNGELIEKKTYSPE